MKVLEGTTVLALEKIKTCKVVKLQKKTVNSNVVSWIMSLWKKDCALNEKHREKDLNEGQSKIYFSHLPQQRNSLNKNFFCFFGFRCWRGWLHKQSSYFLSLRVKASIEYISAALLEDPPNLKYKFSSLRFLKFMPKTDKIYSLRLYYMITIPSGLKFCICFLWSF